MGLKALRSIAKQSDLTATEVFDLESAWLNERLRHGNHSKRFAVLLDAVQRELSGPKRRAVFKQITSATPERKSANNRRMR